MTVTGWHRAAVSARHTTAGTFRLGRPWPDMDWTRREFVAGAAGTSAGLAGCLGDDGTGDDRTPGESGTPWSMPDHAALGDVAGQPRLGPEPGTAPGLVVAFEDPSCPACRQFHERTLPTLRSELVDTGRATFVFRGVPVVAPWGTFATRALEATFARDAAAHWALNAHYFAEQETFSSDNVVSRTSAFLASETDVDADAVVEAAGAGEHDDAVRSDLEAAEATGLRGTPTSYLFAEGSFRTDVVGPQDPSVFENALGV